ncbi:hypothetical protein BO99DRAFT_439067 [Aspergillus violaceofuscus CBS 115571]|uniref:Uncharacterized protein n=1 Tax=Aspergillus violaceofuscus (strain CBS 115571) TaxID=1450538 RepID=A0A2V5HQ99_ASPV1|nr:hypothetical protein BO99DRAFT_439067 [Aspergillus violaceofuscus CBS 115571]
MLLEPPPNPNPGFDSVLDLNLLEDWDDEEGIWYKKLLISLVNGETSPTQAATEIDTYITREPNERYELHRAYTYHRDQIPPHTVLNEDPLTVRMEGSTEEEVTIGAPAPGAHFEMVVRWITRLASAFPPEHVGQDRIVAFLEALRTLPRHGIHIINPSRENDEEDNFYTTLKVWPLDGNFLALSSEVRYEGEAFSYRHYPAIQPPPTDRDLRWRNYQAAIARFTARNLIDCTHLCALEGILPDDGWYPNLDDPTHRDSGYRWLAGWVIAGAQWLLRPEVRSHVYQQCLNQENVGRREDMWSRERWQQWKDQFARLAIEERLGPHARELAGLVRQRMVAHEEEVVLFPVTGSL